jgi:hypothetical protein
MRLLAIPALCVAIAMSGTIAYAEKLSETHYNVDIDWLVDLYSDKTWEWENGHAYFAPDGTFQAAVGPDESAEGKWYGVKDGKICFKATWTNEAGSGPAKKCWKHVADDQKRLWQASLDGGFTLKWAPFDYTEQLIPGNIHRSKFMYASGQTQKIKAKRLGDEALIDTYYGNTWKWQDGHAYFANRGVLTAVAGPDSIGEGTWYPDGRGNLCLDATWTGADYGSVRNTRCWLHAKDEGGTIWQTPDDEVPEWSRFDAKDSLVKGDVYRKRFNRVKRSLRQ